MEKFLVRKNYWDRGNLLFYLAVLASAFALIVSISGCGQSDDFSGYPPSTGSSGSSSSSTTYCPSGQTCEVTGQVYTPYSIYVSSYYGYVLPILNPGYIPSGTSAFNTGISVKKGDILNYLGTGSWGYTSTRDYWGGLIQVARWDCTDMTFSGTHDGTEVLHRGYAAGLYATDGTEVFLLGDATTAKEFRINNDGTLKIGFNADSSGYGATYCASIVPSFSITRCQDSSGNTFACP